MPTCITFRRAAANLSTRSAARLAKQGRSGCFPRHDNPIHPDYLSHRMGACLAPGSVVVSENFSPSDQYMPFGFADDDWELVRTYGRQPRLWPRRCHRRPAGASGPTRDPQHRGRLGDVQRRRFLDHGPLRTADRDGGVEQPAVPDRTQQLRPLGWQHEGTEPVPGDVSG